MDKSAIKNFAVNARKKLKEQIEQKAYALGITNNEIKKPVIHEDTFEVNGNKYEKRVLKHRDNLIRKINEKGFEQVIEEVAYTWFNRIIAIRFMEVNEYLPTGVRVLSSIDSNRVEPDVIREVLSVDLDLNQGLVYKLQDENKTEELFKYILIKQCNELGKIIPVVFEEIEDYTELLLPDNLLQEGSIIRELVTSIEEDDWKEQVEIIGWLYQYYISEKKDEVFEGLKKNIKITKENIPAATQLFTPDWIVKYMVENSLGSLWLESHPNDELKSKWKYYLEEAEQEPEVINKLQVIREQNKELKPEDIKFLDPAMGSGHILVYAFDVFYDIYKSSGYSEREIPKFILENNLYGLDIDDRAAQLAYFAVMMKARSYNRRIFRERIDLNICSIQESNEFSKEAIDFLVCSNKTEIENRIHKGDIEYLINIFNDAKEYGAILNVKKIEFNSLEKGIRQFKNEDVLDIFQLQYKNLILSKIPMLIKQAKIMSQTYNVVCTNPPYMGNRGMGEKLSKYLKSKYKNTKSDISTVFMEKSMYYCSENGFISMINIPSWMFLSTYEDFRKQLIDNTTFVNLLHLGRGIFGSDFGTTSFVLRNSNLRNYKSLFKKVFDKQGEVDNIDVKENMFFETKNVYTNSKENFKAIEGYPIAYSMTENEKKCFTEFDSIDKYAKITNGMFTCNNDFFLRLWHEVDIDNATFDCESGEVSEKLDTKWYPYNKGGEFRKWYGNHEYIINFKYNGREVKEYRREKGQSYSLPGNEFFFKPSISWSFVSSSKFGVRYYPKGFVFDIAGSSLFPNRFDDFYYIIAFLCSDVTFRFLQLENPTLNFQAGNIATLPLKVEDSKKNIISDLARENIDISKLNWDSYESSFNFDRHPLLKYKIDEDNNLVTKIKNSFNKWEKLSIQQFEKLKYNEGILNNIFIDIYGLQKELNSRIEDKDITISKANRERDIKSFISYSVGCMFGRYSLDEDGLICAGKEFNLKNYKNYKVNIDNVIPITDDEYFENDIISRFVDFVKTTFTSETLDDNLDFIADALGKKGNETSRQTIRRYFLKDFYKDHLQTYQKKPIYWLFDSGKNDGFKALIYMHRYDIGNVARVRTDYLHLLQRKYEAEVNRLDMLVESDASTRDKNEARKKKEKIQKQIEECKQYDQVIGHVANQKISIDLDDGVSVNYAKFQGVEVPQGEGKKPLKADLLAKIK